jgi:hypothetical protein
MKKHILAAGAAVLALGSVSIASAASFPCAATYQHPVKAASLKSSLVQAFVSCNNPGGNVPNATTETGTVPTCYPSETYHENAGSPDFGWTWGPKGAGTISFKAGVNKLLPPDYPLNTQPGVDLYIQVKISDIRDNTGVATGTSGSVATVARATLIDRAETSAPMTVIDFPTTFTIGVSGGKVSKKYTATQILNDLNQPSLPHCTTIEVVAVQIKDPNNNTFANLGTYLP